MRIEQLPALATTFYQTHKVEAILVLVVLGLFALLKPKAFFKLLFFLLVAAGLFYAVSMVTDTVSTGVHQKEKMATKTEKALE